MPGCVLGVPVVHVLVNCKLMLPFVYMYQLSHRGIGNAYGWPLSPIQVNSAASSSSLFGL